jgi:ABC-2 type transport system permease protein
MSTVRTEEPQVPAAASAAVSLEAPPPAGSVGFRQALTAEWAKLWTVRSTTWTLASLFVLGVGLTVIICAASADWLASGDADESPGSFVTWGMMFAQIPAVVLGIVVVTSEYARGLITATVAAVPRRTHVVLAKAVVVAGVLLAVATVTAFFGYWGGNAFLESTGVGLTLGDDGVIRALIGCGLYAAVLGVFGMALGLLMRHTAAAVTTALALVFVVGNLVMLVPGAVGEWLAKLMPGNAGSSIAMVTPFEGMLLGPWTGFAVFCAETALLLGVATLRFVRRDA